MNEEKYPMCQAPDPNPTTAGFEIPEGAIDCHAHIFGPPDVYPFSPDRGYTPPGASLDAYLDLHKALGGIDRAVLTQPSVYGVDNSCMLDAVKKMNGKFRAVIAVDASVTDKELQQFHAAGARGVRVNLVDKGGNPFKDARTLQNFTHRIKDMGWHLEVLLKVHEFENLYETMTKMAVDVSFGHLGYMKTDHPTTHKGYQALLNLLREGNCWVKLTGAYRITTSPSTPYDDVKPYAKALIAANEDRIVWGSDWPHPVFTGNMPNDGALMNMLAEWAPDRVSRRKILVDNPELLYGFQAIEKRKP